MPGTKEERSHAYKKIQAEIADRIRSGELRPGDAVESEREVARRYGVSLMTARHALTELEREGLVERRRGAGTFVAPPRIHFNKLMGYSEQMAARSLAVVSHVLALKLVGSAPEEAARLSLPPNARLLKLERLRHAANEPFALETCYFDADRFHDLTRTSLERGSLFFILEHNYGLEIAHADEEIDATPADARTARLLEMQPGEPLLRIRQTIYSAQGKALLYVLGLYRADRHTLHVRRFR